MNSGPKFLAEEKNTHMTHAEDAVLEGGVEGTRRVINYFQAVRDALAGNEGAPINLTIKWDGSHTVFAGIDPSDGRFFVAKKGIFNKTPKVYKNTSEVDAENFSDDLSYKMKLALEHLPYLNIEGVIQGDFLYAKTDLHTINIGGTSHVAFHPNTIVYAIPETSRLANQITQSELGVVWHTSYRGQSFETMSANFGKPIAKYLRKTPKVWGIDAQFRDIGNTVKFTKEESYELTRVLREIGRLFKSIDATTLNGISDHSERLIRVKAYINSCIKKNERIYNPEVFVQDMVRNIMNHYTNEEKARKTDAGKNAVRNKRDAVLAYFHMTPHNQLINMFKLYNLLIDVKLMILYKLNAAKHIYTMILTPTGYNPIGHEGYVITDHLGHGALKLIDRLEFSHSNFSPDIVKGWQR